MESVAFFLKDDHRALQTTTLLSKKWYTAARPQIYYRITIRSRRRLHQLAAHLKKTAIVGYWIKELAIDGGNHYSLRTLQTGWVYTFVDVLKDHLHNLRRLELKGTDYLDLSEPLPPSPSSTTEDETPDGSPLLSTTSPISPMSPSYTSSLFERFFVGLAEDLPRHTLREFMVSESYLTEEMLQALIRSLPQVTYLFLHELYIWKSSNETVTSLLQNFASLSFNRNPVGDANTYAICDGSESTGDTALMRQREMTMMRVPSLKMLEIHQVWKVTETADSPNILDWLVKIGAVRALKTFSLCTTSHELLEQTGPFLQEVGPHLEQFFVEHVRRWVMHKDNHYLTAMKTVTLAHNSGLRILSPGDIHHPATLHLISTLPSPSSTIDSSAITTPTSPQSPSSPLSPTSSTSSPTTLSSLTELHFPILFDNIDLSAQVQSDSIVSTTPSSSSSSSASSTTTSSPTPSANSPTIATAGVSKTGGLDALDEAIVAHAYPDSGSLKTVRLLYNGPLRSERICEIWREKLPKVGGTVRVVVERRR